MQVQPYLFFEGRCEEAIAFYQAAVGAELGMLMRFKEGPPGACDPGNGEKVMHATLRIGGSVVFASDGRCSGQAGFSGVSLSLTAGDDAEAEAAFAALANGGAVTMPMTRTFFASRFGTLTDRFGVSWMVMAEA
jgi:PhnB protein